jgi:hypothetical protein
MEEATPTMAAATVSVVTILVVLLPPDDTWIVGSLLSTTSRVGAEVGEGIERGLVVGLKGAIVCLSFCRNLVVV